MAEESVFIIEDKILQNIKDGYAQLSYKDLKLLKYNDELVKLQEEEEDEVEEDEDEDNVENGSSSKKVEDNNVDVNSIEEEEDDERDLTNLTWLTELRNQTMGFVNLPLDEEPKKDNESSTAEVDRQTLLVTETDIPFKVKTNVPGKQNQGHILQVTQQKTDEQRVPKIINQPKQPSPGERYEMFMNKIKRDLEVYQESATNFQSDVTEKPPFNYSHIIGMAMLENGKRVTLQQICTWIEKKFAFFRLRKKWNNSIRHNLSLHPCFRKIGRNKEDKGKGGYWELGVDPKKCDRKRIRNRKSTAQPNKIQKKHLQSHFIKTSKRRQQNLTNLKKFVSKNCNENLQSFTAEQNYEKLLLDEMDVQQNIDVISTNSHNNTMPSKDSCYKQTDSQAALQSIHETIEHHGKRDRKKNENIILTNYIDNNEPQQENDNFEEFNKNCCSFDGKDIFHGNEQQFSGQTCQQHQYNLSSENVDADMRSVESPNQRTLTSFLTINSKRQLLTEQRQCANSIRYSEFENVPQNDNAIISTCLPHLSDGLSTCTNESTSYQCHNLSNSSSTNSITLDISAFPAQFIQYKPNVVVEPLIQESSLSYSAIKISSDCLPTSSLAATSAYGMQNGDFAHGFVNEHFRPYIDGIDEAFQYLRSIDSTRNEDILDNLLDISVSDY